MFNSLLLTDCEMLLLLLCYQITYLTIGGREGETGTKESCLHPHNIIVVRYAEKTVSQ